MAGAWMWLRMAAATSESPLHRAKRAGAQFYMEYVLPEIRYLNIGFMPVPAGRYVF